MVKHGGDDEAGDGDDVGDVEPLVKAVADGPDGEEGHGGEEAVGGPAPAELGPHEDEAPHGLADARVLVELDAPSDEVCGAKEPDDPAAPLVEEGEAVESVSAKEARGEESEGDLFEGHDEDDGDEAHGDVASAVAGGPPGAVGEGAYGRVGGDDGVGALAPDDAPAEETEGAPGHADGVGGLGRPALGKVKDAVGGADEVGADEGEDDGHGDHEEEEDEPAEAGEGEHLARFEGSIGADEAVGVLVYGVAVDVEALAELVDAVLGGPTLPLGADVGSVAEAEHVEGAEDEGYEDGDEPEEVCVAVGRSWEHVCVEVALEVLVLELVWVEAGAGAAAGRGGGARRADAWRVGAAGRHVERKWWLGREEDGRRDESVRIM
ncbi:hypothetical protein L1887_63084 [Cichorium endivia]|nr:hypothetical protein L1887_63084 [Cichorium endivia]